MHKIPGQDFIRRLEKPSPFLCPHCGASLCFSKKAGRFFQIGAVISFFISPALAIFYSPELAILLISFGLLVISYGLLKQKLLVEPLSLKENKMPSNQNSYPMSITINPDDYHAKHVGRTKDGLQFFLTEPFFFDRNRLAVIEYVALYIFRNDGELFSHNIVKLGQRGEISEDHRARICNELLNTLVDTSITKIKVKAFSVEREGIKFGLIPREPDGDEDKLSVELLPGNYMAFFEPWDSGVYDT